MNLFKKSKQDEIKFNDFISKLDNMCCDIEKYSNTDKSVIEKIKNNFIAKINDFFKEDRKLNIGIIGQVKAGKSSFLNTLLFDGNEILPKAATPKTATLTKIEYSNENSIIIEYYTQEEWKTLEEKALVDSQLNEYIVAKEIMAMVRKNDIIPETYLKKGNETIKFNSYEELMKRINDYVGEDGKFTPLVKSVKLNISNENLKEISVVDTPGLNDPIISRTDKTRQFMKMCDVVFFLSKASGFLDKSDIDLLTAQLPQNGVKKLVLICSRYDDGLVDTICDKGGLKEADVDTKFRLKKHASKTFNKVIERGVSDEFVNIINECKIPIFISSMTHNMAHKNQNEYNDEEKNVYENLSICDEIDNEMLERIGNMDEVTQIFNDVISEKEIILQKKASSFISDAVLEVKNELTIMKQTTEKRINLLSNNDMEKLLKQKKYISSQINNISANIESVFGELNIKLEQSKVEALKALRNSSKEYTELSEKVGTETHTKSYEVSTSKWYNPFSWGTSRTEYYSYDEHYYYLYVSNALENIRNFSKDAANSIENSFYSSIDIGNLKKRLLSVIVENFDTSDDNYDPMYFKLLVEKTLNRLELPVIKIDVSSFLNSISSEFSGELKDPSEKSNLKCTLSNTVAQLFDEISEKFVCELLSFKENLKLIKTEFTNKLLENINLELDIVIKQFEDKETEIEKSEKFIGEIGKMINFD